MKKLRSKVEDLRNQTGEAIDEAGGEIPESGARIRPGSPRSPHRRFGVVQAGLAAGVARSGFRIAGRAMFGQILRGATVGGAAAAAGFAAFKAVDILTSPELLEAFRSTPEGRDLLKISIIEGISIPGVFIPRPSGGPLIEIIGKTTIGRMTVDDLAQEAVDLRLYLRELTAEVTATLKTIAQAVQILADGMAEGAIVEAGVAAIKAMAIDPFRGPLGFNVKGGELGPAAAKIAGMISAASSYNTLSEKFIKSVEATDRRIKSDAQVQALRMRKGR